jgi:hypothetical protein
LSGFFGSSELEVGDIHVGNAARFSGNSAVPGGVLKFNDNTIAHDATCSRNTHSITGSLPDDGPNQFGGKKQRLPVVDRPNQVHWVESVSGFVWASLHRPLPPLPPHRNQALIGGA